jgi:glycosyltransferase involved in cell wall biosynthesis
MVSFQSKLAQGLRTRGIEVVYCLKDTPYSSILVIGGTRDLIGLGQARRQGIPVIQRLNGMNWLHRLRRTGVRHYLRAEYGNFILALIRSQFASQIVYQSKFAQRWWERERGPTRVPARVIYNGVDLERYTPDGPHSRSENSWRVLLVEGRLAGGYEIGLETAIGLVERLQTVCTQPVELVVAGAVETTLQQYWTRHSGAKLQFLGQISADRIPEVDRSAHLLYSADIHAACPNAVVEAMACGLPVVAFDTGALPELVSGSAGRIVPYGSDAWKLGPPDLEALTDAASQVFQEQDRYRVAARARAQAAFGLDPMVKAYIEVLLPGVLG